MSRTLVAVALLALGCVDFSVDRYCAERPELCAISIRTVTPSVGPSEGGTRVHVSGLAIEPDTTVEVGGIPAEAVEVLNVQALQFVTPPHPPGVVDITVRSRGVSFVAKAAFEYPHPPQITEVLPQQTSSAGGRRLTLQGSHFSPNPTVFVDGLAVQPVSWNDASLRALIPAGAPGTQAQVWVENEFGRSNTVVGFEYVVPWEERSNGLPTSEIHRMVVDPADAEHVLALTGEGIFQTLNGGLDWAPISVSTGVEIFEVIFIPSNGLGRLFAATSEGLAWSEDQGVNWTYGPTGPVFSIAADPLDPDRLMAGGVDKVWMSVDGAESWSPEALAVSGEVRAVAVLATGHDSWLAAVGDKLLVRTSTLPWVVNAWSSVGAVRRYTWHQDSELLAVEGEAGVVIATAVGDLGFMKWNGRSISMSGVQGRTVVYPLHDLGAGPTVLRCSDAGVDCVNIGLGLGFSQLNAVAAAPSRPEVVYVGSTTGRVQRTEIATWD